MLEFYTSICGLDSHRLLSLPTLVAGVVYVVRLQRALVHAKMLRFVHLQVQ